MSKWDAATAEWYAEKYGEYATNRLAVDRLELSPSALIVDIGCGTGAALRRASLSVTDGRLIGVDPIDRMVEIARKYTVSQPGCSRIEFRVGAAENLPIDDAAADVVLAFDSFDHWQDQRAGLAEVRRIIRPGGRFVVVKDGGIPGARAPSGFLDQLSACGFVISAEEHVSQDGVEFTMWVCECAEAEA